MKALVLLFAATAAFGQARDTRMGVNGAGSSSSGSGGTTYSGIADGGVIVAGSAIYCAPASGTGSGCVDTTTQTFLGSKTFTNTSTHGALISNGNLTFAGGDTNFLIKAQNTNGRLTFQSHLNASTASTTVGPFMFQQTNGTLDATDLELAVLDSADVILFSVNGGATISNRGGHQLNIAGAAEPTCDSTTRGLIWYTAGGAGVADKMQVCAKAAADTYAWRSMATIP